MHFMSGWNAMFEWSSASPVLAWIIFCRQFIIVYTMRGGLLFECDCFGPVFAMSLRLQLFGSFPTAFLRIWPLFGWNVHPLYCMYTGQVQPGTRTSVVPTLPSRQAVPGQCNCLPRGMRARHLCTDGVSALCSMSEWDIHQFRVVSLFPVPSRDILSA